MLHDGIGNSNVSKLMNCIQFIFSHQLTLLLNPVSPAIVVLLIILLRMRRRDFLAMVQIGMIDMIKVTNIFKETWELISMILIQSMNIDRVRIAIWRNLIFISS